MSAKIEDILYQALSEGIRNEVLSLAATLRDIPKYKWMEVGDRMEIAYKIVKEQKEKTK